MPIAITGSIATDHLMRFPGRFVDQLLPDQLESVSLSFLVDHLDVRRGGVAANIAFGLAALRVSPVLVGAAGVDFGEYRAWLDDHGVDTGSVLISQDKHTARFVCTTDESQNQIASFYAGAMAEARSIELRQVAERVGELDLVVIAADDPVAMVRHTEECRERGYPFAADPSQQLARMDGDEVRMLIGGARYLFTNKYESQLLLRTTGWTEPEVLERVGYWITTEGADGVRIQNGGGQVVSVPAVPVKEEVEPTGVGDAFRAGFLWGLHSELSMERSAQVGCGLASVVLETVGTQEYELDRSRFCDRLARVYGDAAAAEIGERLSR